MQNIHIIYTRLRAGNEVNVTIEVQKQSCWCRKKWIKEVINLGSSW